MADVEIRTLKVVDMKGGTVVAAFPSIGLVSTITATYMITNLKVDQVTALARAELDKRGIQQLESGMITGVTGVLLNEGRWRNADVAALLAEARTDIPDARAAVALVHALDLLLPEIEIDLKPLQAQAKALEDHLTKLKQQAAAVVAPEPIPSDMYR